MTEAPSKTIRIKTELLNRLKEINSNINTAVTELLQKCNNEEINTKLKHESFIKEIEKSLITIAKLKTAVEQHTTDILEIQGIIEKIVSLNKLRSY